MIALQPWQEALKHIEESSAQEELSEQLEKEFTRIGAKRKLTKADWISVTAIMASHLIGASAVAQSIPEIATGLVALGLSKSGKAGGEASAEMHAQRRNEVAAWLRERFTPDSFAKRRAITAALYEARDKFCDDTFVLSEKTFRLIAKEAGLKK